MRAVFRRTIQLLWYQRRPHRHLYDAEYFRRRSSCLFSMIGSSFRFGRSPRRGAAYPRERYMHIAGSCKPVSRLAYATGLSFEASRGTMGWESFQMIIRYRYCRCPIHSYDSGFTPPDFRFSYFKMSRKSLKGQRPHADTISVKLALCELDPLLGQYY